MQFVDLPVRMEVLAFVRLPSFATVSAPVGIKDPAVRTEMNTIKNMLACRNWSMKHNMYTVYFTFAVCSPACRNGGTCHISSNSATCICPSGYSGSYCQKRGMCTQPRTCMHVCMCM